MISPHAGYFPTEDGMIAPGMKCSFIVTFTPDSLASYRETMKVSDNNNHYGHPGPLCVCVSVGECGCKNQGYYAIPDSFT